MQPQPTPERSNNWKNIVIILLSVTVFILAAVLLYDKNKNTKNLADERDGSGIADSTTSAGKNLSADSVAKLQQAAAFARGLENIFLTQTNTSQPAKLFDEPIDYDIEAKPCIDTFYKYAKRKLRIDTTLRYRPRLTLGVGFGGANLKDWICDRINKDDANEIRIELGLYNKKILVNHPSNEPGEDKRLGRITAFLVAYKTVADKQSVSSTRVGTAYNLGHLYP